MISILKETRVVGHGALLALVVFAASCDRRQDLAPTGPVSGIARNVGPAAAHVRPAEAPFAELSKMVPSSAGFIYDPAGNIVVFVRESAEMPGAAHALSALVSSKRINLRADRRQMPAVIVKRADFTFQQLAAWRDTVGNYIDNTAGIGVVSLDLNEGTNRLTVGVRTSANRQQLLSAFAALAVDTKAVEFETAAGFGFLSRTVTPRDAVARSTAAAASMSLQSIQANASQLVGGLSIGIARSDGRGQCTLSFAAREYQNGITTTGFLTASHCTQNLFAYDGDAFYQATFGSFVGNEKDDPQGYRCGIYNCNVADATFVQTTPGTNVGLGLIAKGAGGLQYDTSDLWIVTQAEHNDVYLGQPFSWVGQTSGFHTDIITNTCVDFWHNYDFPSFSEYKTTCEEMTSGTAQGGDSGGTVYIPLGTGNEVEAVGMISGNYFNTSGKMCFTRVSRIQANFATENGTIYFGPPSPPSPTITLTGTLNGSSNPSLAWTAYPGALNYNLYRKDVDGGCTDLGTTLLYSGTSTSYVDWNMTGGGITLCPSSQYYVVATTSNSVQESNNVVFAPPQ